MLTYFRENEGSVVAGSWLFMLGSPVFAWFVGALRTRLTPAVYAILRHCRPVYLLILPIGWIGLLIGFPVWTIGTSVMLLLQRAGDRVAMA